MVKNIELEDLKKIYGGADDPNNPKYNYGYEYKDKYDNTVIIGSFNSHSEGINFYNAQILSKIGIIFPVVLSETQITNKIGFEVIIGQ